ncbi:MAG TPA: DNA polymerase III subunit beta [Fibrobacteres bacterium]|nr:DNA polymerase III subunit beta [Fibrobacterota bacterium]
MECKINKNELYELIQKTYPVVPIKSSMASLSNLKLTFGNGKIEISATDLDHSIIASFPVSCEENMEITVNAKKIFEIVRELPDGEILLDIDENVLIIESEKGFSCKISGANANDFPLFPVLEEGESFEIEVSFLKELILKSSFAVSKDESRTCLCGILWQTENNKTGMVATDGHRLGSSFIKGIYEVKEKVEIIVSQKTLLHILRIFDSTGAVSKISIKRDEKYVLFSDDKIKICSKLIEGPYPDYDKAIPKSNPKFAIVEKEKFLEAVKRVSVLSNQKTHLVKCLYKQDQIEISVFNRDIGGEAHEIIPVQYSGEEHGIGFNAMYLMEIMNIIRQPKIRMEMNTQISACIVFPHFEKEEDKKSEDTFLIMPLRITDEL